MSTLGFGAILGVPLVAAGAAAVVTAGVAVAVAGAGVVVAQKTGQTVIACGREMKLMAQENRAMQQALRKAAQKYDERLRHQELERATMQQAETQQRLQEQRAALQRQEQRLAKMQRAAAAPEIAFDWESIARARAQVLAAEPPTDAAQNHRVSGWWERVRRLRAMTDGLRAALNHFTSGPGKGLFVTVGLDQALQGVEAQLQEYEDVVDALMRGDATLPAAALENLLATLEFVDGRLQEMRVQTPHRIQQRKAAVDATEKAGAALVQVVARPDVTDYLATIEMLRGMLDEAAEEMTQANFERARSTSEAVLRHLEQMETVLVEQRRANLSVLLAIYRSKVEPLQRLPELTSRVAGWQSEHSRLDRLIEQDIEAAWQQAGRAQTGLFARADVLQQDALDLLLQRQSQMLNDITTESLREMSYQIAQVKDEEGSYFIEARKGQRRMYVTLSEDGQMVVKADGFGDASCKPELQHFLQLLQDKGLHGAWQEKFVLTDSVQRLVRLLHEAGLNVKVEPTDGGVTVLAANLPGAEAHVNYDGSERLSSEMMDRLWQGQIQRGKSYADLTSEMDDEWVRRQEDYRRQEYAARVQVATG